MYRAGVLGSYADALDEDFAADVDASTYDDDDPDLRAAYLTWTTAVKNAGGVVAASPGKSETIDAGMPAARYPVAVIAPAPTYNLNPMFHAWPDLWTGNGAYGWYKAPAIARRYLYAKPRSFWDMGTWFSSAPPGVTPQQAPGESPPVNPDWYEQAIGVLKAGGWIVGGVLVLTVLSYIPRPRHD